MTDGKLAMAGAGTKLLGSFADTHLTDARQFGETVGTADALIRQDTGSKSPTVLAFIGEQVTPKLENLDRVVRQITASPLDAAKGLGAGISDHLSGGAKADTTTIAQAVGGAGKSSSGRSA